MITQDNRCSEVGDVLIFQTVIMIGVKKITSYTDTLEGVTGTRLFNKQFRWSVDSGITFGNWFTLDNTILTEKLNFSSLLGEKYRIVLQLRYERIGTDTTGDLVVTDFNLNGEFTPLEYRYKVASKTIYKDIIVDYIEVLNLARNLTQKFHAYGVISKFLSRKDDVEGDDMIKDKDYIDFWQVVAHFFAMFFVQVVQFSNIYWRRNMLCEYLKQNNIFLCNCDNMIELQLIAQNFYDEIRQRGTEEIFHKKGYEYSIGYRYAYELPVAYEIRPAYPVQIDGVRYKEVSTLPFGWIVKNNRLVAPEKNYHEVKFFNDGNNLFDINPVSKITLLPTPRSGILKRYHGEYLRLICYNECDEFIFHVVKKKDIGWWVDGASPLYRGLRPQRGNLIKGYEKTYEVEDLTKYPIFNPSRVYIGSTTLPNGQQGTVMYVSSDGEPCYTTVPPISFTVSDYLKLNASYYGNNNVTGYLNIVNIDTLESFAIPLDLLGDPLTLNSVAVETDLVPGNYRVEFNLGFVGKLVGMIKAGALEFPFTSENMCAEIISLEEVNVGLIEVILNFSLT